MRVMIDTNVFMSALLSSGSVCHKVLNQAMESHDIVLCDYIVAECYNVANRKFPKRIKVLDNIFAKLRYELVPTPRTGLIEMADVKDQPILDAAIQYNVDVLVSGDKHFLSLSVKVLDIVAPIEFLKNYS